MQLYFCATKFRADNFSGINPQMLHRSRIVFQKTKFQRLYCNRYTILSHVPKKMIANSSLLQWLATFKLDGQALVEIKDDAYYNLADGYVCARILNQIAPQYFSDSWLDGIKPVPPNGSWRLRVSNLKRILQKIHDYASDLQSQQFRTSAITPDVAVIAQNFDPDQISRLIQLILFCAINCDKKQDFIEKIHDLPTQVKQDIKEAIEELLVRNDDTNNSANTSRVNTSQVDSVRSETGLNTSYRSNSSFTTSTPTKTPQRSFLGRNSSQSSFDASRNLNESNLDNATSPRSTGSRTIEDIEQRLNEALKLKDEKSQACHELELKLKQIQAQYDQMASENERLLSDRVKSDTVKATETRRASASASQTSSPSKDINRSSSDTSDEPPSELMKVQYYKLQNEVHRLKDEIIRIENEKEEFRLKSSLLQEDLDKLISKHDEIRNKADQAKRLQDELDEQRQISEKVISYESKIENLIKRNNEMKSELKSLEKKNVGHIQTIVKLEEDNRQLTRSVGRIDIVKKQLQEIQVKLCEETHRADKAEVELARVNEKFIATRRENEKLLETTNQLIQSGGPGGAGGDPAGSGNFGQAMGASPDGQQSSAGNNMSPTSSIELKERLVRLEIENEMLQNKLNSKRESDNAVLGGLLDNANSRCSNLELENRQAKKKILLLETRLKDLTNLHGGLSNSQGTSALPADSSSDNVLALISRVEDLQRLLFQKDQELMELESKYKKNIHKAREVMKTLNNNQSINNSLNPACMSSTSSFNSGSLDEANLLRIQLRERETRLLEMEREFSEYKRLKEVHERLILSAFYGLTTPIQRKNAEKRLERTTLTSPPNTASSSLNHSKHSH